MPNLDTAVTAARSPRRARLGDLILRGLLTAIFLLAAGMKLTSVPFEVSGFERFGYPLWFMFAVGGAQLVGALMLWRRGLIAYGAGLLAVLMVGAVTSHLRAGDPVTMALPAAVLVVLCASVAFAWRREAYRSVGAAGGGLSPA